jgi:transcriptional antiterminator
MIKLPYNNGAAKKNIPKTTARGIAIIFRSKEIIFITLYFRKYINKNRNYLNTNKCFAK